MEKDHFKKEAGKVQIHDEIEPCSLLQSSRWVNEPWLSLDGNKPR
jgi:hypothetical protein